MCVSNWRWFSSLVFFTFYFPPTVLFWSLPRNLSVPHLILVSELFKRILVVKEEQFWKIECIKGNNLCQVFYSCALFRLFFFQPAYRTHGSARGFHKSSSVLPSVDLSLHPFVCSIYSSICPVCTSIHAFIRPSVQNDFFLGLTHYKYLKVS